MRGSIHGYVVRIDPERPVAEATVTLFRDFGSAPGVTQDGVRSSNGAGWFTFEEIPAGHWRVVATGPVDGRGEARVRVFDNAITEVTIDLNGLHRWRAKTLGPGQANDTADWRSDEDSEVRSEPTRGGTLEHQAPASRDPVRIGSVRGRVVHGATGMPVSDATIGIIRGAGPAPDIAPMTDAEGRFAMDGLPWGAWTLSAVDRDGQRGQAKVKVWGHAIAEIVIQIGHDATRRPTSRASPE